MTKRVEPVRTCVGCRVRVAKSHLHPDPDCLALAERRRAFRKALRLDRAPDPAALQTYLAELASPTDRAEPDDERSMSQHR